MLFLDRGYSLCTGCIYSLIRRMRNMYVLQMGGSNQMSWLLLYRTRPSYPKTMLCHFFWFISTIILHLGLLMGSEQRHSNNITLNEQRRWRDYVLPPRSTHMLLNRVCTTWLIVLRQSKTQYMNNSHSTKWNPPLDKWVIPAFKSVD